MQVLASEWLALNELADLRSASEARRDEGRFSLTACLYLVFRREGVSASFSMPRAKVNEASM